MIQAKEHCQTTPHKTPVGNSKAHPLDKKERKKKEQNLGTLKLHGKKEVA